MRMSSMSCFALLLSDLVYGSYFNEHIFESSEMNEIDFKVLVTSAVLLDKDLSYIARLIKSAHDLGLQTRYLKGIVLNHLISINNDQKYHKFKD